jgi:hypothetical protein
MCHTSTGLAAYVQEKSSQQREWEKILYYKMCLQLFIVIDIAGRGFPTRIFTFQKITCFEFGTHVNKMIEN